MTIPLATFSLAAFDENGLIAAATSSHFLAVGSLVPHIRTGVGAILTQSIANPSAVESTFDHLEATGNPEAAVEFFLQNDPQRHLRQVAILSLNGKVASFSGASCTESVEVIEGENFVALGNTLKTGTIPMLAEKFSTARQENEELLQAIVTAFAATEAKLGDKRGKLSAALIGKKAKAGYGESDTVVDLRVDAAATACHALVALFECRKLYLSSYASSEWIAVSELDDDARQLLEAFTRLTPGLSLEESFQNHNLAHLYDASAEAINRRVLTSLPYYLASLNGTRNLSSF